MERTTKSSLTQRAEKTKKPLSKVVVLDYDDKPRLKAESEPQSPAKGNGRPSTDVGEGSSKAKRPSVYNPLTDEFDNAVRAVSTRALPTGFTSPPLMEGLVTSVHGVLGPQARPTPIQALSLKHMFRRPLEGSIPPKEKGEWSQTLLASETGSGKSIAYLLPMLQDLKLSELYPDTPSGSEAAPSNTNEKAKEKAAQPRTLLSPRALVLAPTHELSRQLSSFAKALLHAVKLRVLCISQANLPSSPRAPRSLTSARMAKEFDALFGEDAGGEAESALVRRPPRSVDVVVGTPSKILEMVKGRGWDREQPNAEDFWEQDEHGRAIKPKRWTVGKPEIGLEKVEWVVIDEADVLFDPDFQEQTKLILSSISEARGQPIESPPPSVTPDPASPVPINYPFNLLLSTATIPSALAWYLDTYHPKLTRLASPNLHHLPKTLKTEYSSWTGGNRNADIERRLRQVWGEDALSGGRALSKVLVFCNKSTKVEGLGKYLEEKGVANVALTSTSEERKYGSNHHLDGFLRQRGAQAAEQGVAKPLASVDVSKEPHVMITTSLLSRGLDFAPDIKHVFIVDEPRNMVDFLHRAGRSGRAGEKGKVVVFGRVKGRGAGRTEEMRQKIKALRA
ncbi:DEAD-domain-containing protein [Wolfiporia cocos MD-104 SS10]|uniref:RNA helicase n=1 Tax=Wolfiporia cocos (strain MD-104) TaxID=742152 RepID=A0A2H3ISQ7_WOLCO|nr:DEAD-domain-containing protein [Wolfiporia cocos MD-104 SS10]